MEELKSALRQQARAILRQITPAERAAAGTRIASCLRQLPLWPAARTVLAFQPLLTEPDLTALWATGFDPDKIWTFPKIHGHHLELYSVCEPGDFEPGALGILEPRPVATRRMSLTAIDLALVPGIAFDSSGGRLGRGRGFYDRLLSQAGWRGTALGIAFRQTEQISIPRADHDQALDGIIWSDGTVSGPWT